MKIKIIDLYHSGAFPWMVLIGYRNNLGELSWKCGKYEQIDIFSLKNNLKRLRFVFKQAVH